MSAVDVHSLACRFVGALCRGCLKGLLAGACVGSSLFSCGMVTFNERNMLLSRCQNSQAWPSWSVFWLCRCLLHLEAEEMFSVCRPVSCSCWSVGSVGGRVGITVISARGLCWRQSPQLECSSPAHRLCMWGVRVSVMLCQHSSSAL